MTRGRADGSPLSTPMKRSYRIGFLNPWEEGAEIQAFMSLSMAAQRIGYELVRVRNSQEIIEAEPDFVLAIEPGQPKTTDVPTFGVVHSPRSILLESKSHLEDISYLQSLLTYDGYLTIADSLRNFIEALCAGAGRPPHVGFYYNTPQRQGLICGLEKLAAQDALQLCYFGINWEPRARPLFRALAQRPYMRIYGPPRGWEYLRTKSYCGEVPFDGQSVQRIYALFGIGLVVLSTQHMIDDVVSNRIFEIASVGAAAICPQIPWIRKNFGDSVFYYDPFAEPADTIARIDGIVDEIRRNPKAAAQQALAARAIFDEKFAAVHYFAEWRERAGRTRDPADGPLIDVVIRALRSPIGNVYRALRSIDGQTAGRFRVILVCCNGLDASGLAGASWKRIDSFEIVNLAADDPGMALVLGLKAVRTDLFAFLEEDDFWLCTHIAALLPLDETAPSGRAYAYSGVLQVEEPSPGHDTPADNAAGEQRRIASLAPLAGDIEQIADALVLDSFLASSALLQFVDFDNLAAGNTGAVVLQANLISRAEPAFSHRATLCIAAPERGSAAAHMGMRAEEQLESLLRLHAMVDGIERKLPKPAVPVWSRLQHAMQRVVEAQRLALSGEAGVLALEGGTIITSMYARDDLERERITLLGERIGLEGHSHLIDDEGQLAVSVWPPESAWAYGVRINLDGAELLAGSQWVVVEFSPVAEAFGIGLLDSSDNFLTRMQVPVSAVPVEAWLHMPDPAALGALIVQNWVSPLAAEILLRRAWIVRERHGDIPEASPGISATAELVPISHTQAVA
jgi:hypothetical protein